MDESQDSPIIAHDDNGQPITEQDLVTESYRKPLPNSPANLMPPIDFEGDEEDWEQQQIIEAVRARRRERERAPDDGGSMTKADGAADGNMTTYN